MVAAAIGAAIVGSMIYQGEQSARMQRRALREQSKAQEGALASSIRQERANTEAIARANRKTPDIGAMIAGQLAAAAAGGNRATMLSRPTLGGAQPNLDPLAATPKSGELLGQ